MRAHFRISRMIFRNAPGWENDPLWRKNHKINGLVFGVFQDLSVFSHTVSNSRWALRGRTAAACKFDHSNEICCNQNASFSALGSGASVVIISAGRFSFWVELAFRFWVLGVFFWFLLESKFRFWVVVLFCSK